MDKNLSPITLTRKISDIHSGGFSMEEEKALGFNAGELFETPKDDAMALMRHAFQKPHDFLFLNVDNQRIFQDYDELILHTENNNLD